MNKKNLYTLALTIVAGLVATAQTTVLANFNFNGSASYPPLQQQARQAILLHL